MIVDHAHCLHEGVTNGRADESKPPFLEIFAEGIGKRRMGRHFGARCPLIDKRLPIDETPQVSVEGSEGALYLQEGLGVRDGRGNL